MSTPNESTPEPRRALLWWQLPVMFLVIGGLMYAMATLASGARATAKADYLAGVERTLQRECGARTVDVFRTSVQDMNAALSSDVDEPGADALATISRRATGCRL